MPNPQRGEVWIVDLGLAAKVRPGLVISIPIGTEQSRCHVRGFSPGWVVSEELRKK